MTRSTVETDLIPLTGESSVYYRLLTNFTHQIINPLNGVVGTLDNVIDGVVPDGKRTQRLRAVRAQLCGTIELVRNLAFLSQLSTEEGSRSLKTQATPLSVTETIIEAQQLFNEAAQNNHIELHLADRFTQYMIEGHQPLLRQVFVNIIDNGVKYGDKDSRLDIVTRVQKKSHHLLIEFIGQGVGFRHEERADIFRLGVRGHDAQARKASGSGIGLYICKQIVEIVHGGFIEAEHSDGTGKTIFRVRFPTFSINEERTRRIREQVSRNR